MHENPKETRQCHNIPEPSYSSSSLVKFLTVAQDNLHGRDTDRMLGDIWLFLQDVVLTQIPSTLLSFANCAHVAKYTFPSFSTNQYTCHTAPWYLSPSRSTHPFHNQNIISIASLEHRVVQSAFAMRHQVKLALVQTISAFNRFSSLASLRILHQWHLPGSLDGSHDTSGLPDLMFSHASSGS